MKPWGEQNFYKRKAGQETKRARQLRKGKVWHERWLRIEADALKKFQEEIEQEFPFAEWTYYSEASVRMAETVINGETAWVDDSDTFVLHLALGIERITGLEYFRRALECGRFPEFLERMRAYKNSLSERAEFDVMLRPEAPRPPRSARL